jgi:hypothetical protein
MIRKDPKHDHVNPPGQVVYPHPLAKSIDQWKYDQAYEAGFQAGYAAAQHRSPPPDADNSESAR